jgi:soluble lytic murein transglycosylase-like protein
MIGKLETYKSRRALPTTRSLVLRGAAVFAGALLLVTAVGVLFARSETPADLPYTGRLVVREFSALRKTLDETSGEVEVLRLELARANAVIEYSARYRIPADLAGLIYDTALKAGIDPELAFRLIKVESNFDPRATSPAGAVGLAQVLLRTAQFYEPGITVERLYDPATNLWIGFRYLRDLLGTYQGDLRLALLAYNRGPAKVNELLQLAQDPANGYARSVMKGYRRGGGDGGLP